jgi:hypothetical protein
MSLGVERKTLVGKYGTIDLGIGWVRRFGPNLTPERREFWNINMDMVFDF